MPGRSADLMRFDNVYIMDAVSVNFLALKFVINVLVKQIVLMKSHPLNS